MELLEFSCADGQALAGRLWPAAAPTVEAVVVIGGATGVSARYYHRYAAFLASQGFTVITFDYRGIGASSPERLRGFKARWYEWGLHDIDAVLDWAHLNHPGLPLRYVGHSFGGFGVGLAAASRHVDRILAIGSQHAYWRDYAPGSRLAYWRRWHLMMPIVTALKGYFPGKRLRLEDLPRGVALDWARSARDFTAVAPRRDRASMRSHQAALTASILAVAPTDDPFASPRAMHRALAYHPNSERTLVRIAPGDLGREELGHFALFRAGFADTFWADTVTWLRDGTNPWALQAEVGTRSSGG